MTLKIIHTSDWHLGQNFYNLSRHGEHQRFLKWLVELLLVESADVLLIAGDLFDTGNPPPSALELYYTFLSEVAAALPRMQVLTIGGNHDSASRLDAPAALLSCLRVTHVGGFPTHAPERAVVPLLNSAGTCEAWVLAIPFLRPCDFTGTLQNPEQSSIEYATEKIYKEATATALKLRTGSEAILAMGHCFMAGGEISELSERKIQRGNQEALNVEIFSSEICYVALGHLHKSQCVGKKSHIRYSGSPIPLSFAERNYNHQVVLFEIENGSLTHLKEISVPRSKEFLCVPKRHENLTQVLVELENLAKQYPKNSTPSANPHTETQCMPYLEVRVELESPQPDLRNRIEKALETAAVQLVRIDTRNKINELQKSLSAPDLPLKNELCDLNPVDLFIQKYSLQYSGPMPKELLETFHDLVAIAHSKEEK